MNARDLAKLLKPYEVTSVDVKVDGVNRKGYRREHLHAPVGCATCHLHMGVALLPLLRLQPRSNDGWQVAGSG
jgi:hypothetical protein